MNIRFGLIDVKRIVRNPANLVFAILLPAGMYLLFGAIQGYADANLGHGNVRAAIMASMASYGSVTVATTLAATSALEQEKGWGRQLAMTPLVGGKYLATKVLTVLVVSFVPVLVVYVIGALTSAQIDGDIRWGWAFLASWLTAVPFAFFGLGMALLIRGEAALSLASFGVLICAFLSNMFIPLSGLLLSISRFMPLYGVNKLARFPISGSEEAIANGAALSAPIWWAVANIVVWTVVFALLAFVASKRPQKR
ncbi:permease [Corynebacterium ulcerans]|uniref:ABC transporter permease n=1 Tax=Corynebacterium ulcerans TaxID=65058 RepID=UPI0005FEA9F4|nr:ABC transporter permease [Corynebacterium ulcerans]AKA97243.1 ABC-2 family transporter protein [Corynebacterium ulcerans]KKO86034.1 permease [Corynebacterium ulcerans]KPJ23642.1 permease [Corynebacterium ulcerans]OAG71222.1 permease [Corynebacterium ulcerans]BDV26525.1 ABC transporter [Corynebacterium ulcerans]